MSVPMTSIGSARASFTSVRKPHKQVMWSAIFGPPYGCHGRESISFNEDVMRAREAAAKGILPVVGEMGSPTGPVEANRG